MTKTVAVLGGGIMGVMTALFLARRGMRVSIFDQQSVILNGASRWNEGKIHLGYLYSGDGSGNSARSMLGAGIAFRPLIESQIERSMRSHITKNPDHYIVHKKSVVSPDAVGTYFSYLNSLVERHDTSGYLGPVRPARELSKDELQKLCGENGLAGFEVPEYSIDTQWLADQLVETVLGNSKITLVLGKKVVGVKSRCGGFHGPWQVNLEDQCSEGGFDLVVNALWQGRPSIDHGLGLPVATDNLYRFRKSVFLTTKKTFDVPSRVFVVGPFGDLKNYDGSSFYMSWYPAGLISQGNGIYPPSSGSGRTDKAVFEETRTHIEKLAPDMAEIFNSAETVRIEGGWVFTRGTGRLDDANASIHRRDRYGTFRKENYFSVDTGKYSTAPYMAQEIARSIAS
ncbi:MAG: FAD-dependent oxidoreductase [Litorimonas sp.]